MSVAKQLNQTIRTEGMNQKCFFKTKTFPTPSNKSPFLSAYEINNLVAEDRKDGIIAPNNVQKKPSKPAKYNYRVESYCEFRGGRFYTSNAEYRIDHDDV